MRWFYPILWTALTIVCSFLLAEMSTDSYLRIANVEYFTDQSGTQTIEAVRNQQFVSSENKTIPSTAEVIWLKITIPEKLQTWEQDAVLFTGSNETALSMEGFIAHDQGVEYWGYCDVEIDSTKCPMPTLQYTFPVKKSEFKNRVYYLKVVPGASGINNEFYFMKQSYFNKATIFLVHFIGLSTGVYLVVALLALIFFSSFKEPSFLIYALFYLNLLASITINRGIWDAYRPNDIVFTGSTLVFPVLILTVFFDLLFIRAFFEIKKRHPRLNLIYMIFLAAIVGIIFLSFFPETQVLAWKTLTPAVFSSMFLTSISLVYFIWKKRLWAEQIATAWGVAIVCNLIWAGYRAGVIEGFWFFGYFAIFGRTLEGLILNTVIFQKLQKLTLKVGFAQALGEESKVVKTLLRTLSHDLSNTTQLVKTTAQVLKENTEDANIMRNIDRILHAAQEQSDIIENAKNSFLVRGKHVLNLVPVNLKKSINEVIEMYQPEIKRKNLLVVVNIEDNLQVLAEKTSLTHQVLSNLISNACKFSHDGKSIHIAASFQEPFTIELKIKDQGVGIPHQLLDRIFDDEVDIRQVGTTGEMGTGSGLLIARDFMAVYGGNLQVESTVDKGAEVTLRFQSFK
ncbi:MAG: sensor histidine kinase [Pseudobdellovibrio sp.]|nr:sensor histidine kinase [Pseudobdellovibrio sp.]